MKRDGAIADDNEKDWLPPRDPHWPGRNQRPGEDDPVSLIACAAPKKTEPAAWRANEAYCAGLRLYAHGYYWEAHEVWEPVWANATLKSQERALTQGLIQLANAALKLKMDQPRAAGRLATIAKEHLREAALGAAGVVMGVDLAAAVSAAGAFADCLTRGQAAEPPIIPLASEI